MIVAIDDKKFQLTKWTNEGLEIETIFFLNLF